MQGSTYRLAAVVRDALNDWKRRRALKRNADEALRHLWRAGLASGPGRFVDLAAIKSEARRRLSEAPRATSHLSIGNLAG